MSQSTKYDSSRVQATIERITENDRAMARGIREILEKIEAIKNPLKRGFAIKLFCDILDYLTK